jgi:uncharacterized protein YigE (DUF2233 family)
MAIAMMMAERTHNFYLWLAAGLLALLVPGIATADTCRDLTHEGRSYSVCEVTAGQDLRLFHTGADGLPYATFDRVEAALAAEGQGLAFAMNAGMYHPDRRPVGLMIEAGVPRARIVTREGPGNFGLLPNGVFCIAGDAQAVFSITESRAFAAAPPACRHATQSGPMLVIDGKLHPGFRPASDSRFIRNGVGVSADGQRAVFAISDQPVNFHEFARLFRDVLQVPNALYLDGKVSRLHAPSLGRSDLGYPMGPIVGLAEPLRQGNGHLSR